MVKWRYKQVKDWLLDNRLVWVLNQDRYVNESLERRKVIEINAIPLRMVPKL